MTAEPDVRLLSNCWNPAGEPFNLYSTMMSGQAFRWRQDAAGSWWGAVENCIVAVRQCPGSPELWWQTFPEPGRWRIVADLFRLDVALNPLYEEWIKSEPAIQDAIEAFPGLRIMRQSPVECFFAFQCASCNTVIKIERSVHLLAQRYGGLIEHELNAYCLPVYRFPCITELAAAEESVLRADLWGYRAPRVIELARRLADLGEDWLVALRGRSYREAHSALCELPGIGPKVADCICLFALDKDEAVPIDTHTWQIARRLFAREACPKTLTARAYYALADIYRDRFGPYAGWAQQYLFFAELRRGKSLMLKPELAGV